MISAKKLIKMARKWQKMAEASRKRLSWMRPVAEKGHFVVYTIEGRRFMVPLECLKSEIFRELLRMAEEEFGISSSGVIKLPFDSDFMEYIILMIQIHATHDLEKAMIKSLSSCLHSSLSYEHQQEQTQPPLFISSF